MRQVVISAVLVTAFHLDATGAEVIYLFEGNILQSAPVFGLPKPVGSFTGRVIYDSSQAANYPLDGDAMGYRQQRPNGFYALFGDMEVRADDYIVQVFNDLPQGASGVADVVTIGFASDYAPPLDAPLIVNGAPQPAGHLLLSFFWFGGQKFQQPVLEEVGSITGYDLAMALLGDSGREQTADVFANQITTHQTAVLTADFDQNSIIDGADFLIWQREFGSPASPTADANADGAVTELDLLVWKTQWGQFNAPAAAAAPESGAGQLMLQAIFIVAGVAANRRAR